MLEEELSRLYDVVDTVQLDLNKEKQKVTQLEKHMELAKQYAFQRMTLQGDGLLRAQANARNFNQLGYLPGNKSYRTMDCKLIKAFGECPQQWWCKFRH